MLTIAASRELSEEEYKLALQQEVCALALIIEEEQARLLPDIPKLIAHLVRLQGVLRFKPSLHQVVEEFQASSDEQQEAAKEFRTRRRTNILKLLRALEPGASS